MFVELVLIAIGENIQFVTSVSKLSEIPEVLVWLEMLVGLYHSLILLIS